MFNGEILLLDEREITGEVIALNLKVYVGANTQHFREIKQATEALKADKSMIDCVIVHAHIDGTDTPNVLMRFLDSIGFKKPVLVLGKSSLTESDQITLLDDNSDFKPVIQKVAQILRVTAEDMVQFQTPRYYPIDIKFLFPGLKLPVRVYRPEGESFRSVLEDGSTISREVVNLLEGSVVSTLYVRAIERLKFIQAINKQFSARLRDDSLGQDQKVDLIERTQALVQMLVNKLNIDDTVVELTNATIGSLTKVIEKCPNFKVMVQSILNDEQSFRYQLCLLTSYICAALNERMPWGNNDQINKLCMVSFFHDMTLQEEASVAIREEEELEASEYSEVEKEAIRNHALDAAKLIQCYPELPVGVAEVVKQHHGSRNGIGYNDISQNISHLSVVFILAEEYAFRYLKSDNEDNHDKLIADITDKYGSYVKFKKYITALSEIRPP